MSRLRFILSPFMFVPFIGSAEAAGLGENCASTTDCDKGLACETIGSTACACPAGEECDCPAEGTDIKACMPGPCTNNEDCGGDLVCISFEMPCAVPAMECAPGSECPPPPECTPTTESACGPRWALPCEDAAECGEGFACEPIEICECSGSSGGSDPGSPPEPDSPPTPDGGGSGDDSGSSGSESGSSGSEGSEEMPPPEDGCTCRPGDENACRPLETVCEDDSTCPKGWVCQKADVVEPTCPEGQSCDPMPPANNTGTCAPEGWGVGATNDARDGSVDLSGGSPETAAPTATPTQSEVETSGGACQGGGLNLFGAWVLGIVTLLRRRR